MSVRPLCFLFCCLQGLFVGAGLLVAGGWNVDYGLPLMERFGSESLDPDRYIWTAFEDEDGVLYFGQDHLLRFDGSHWSRLGPSGLDVLRGVDVDASGRLWIAAFNEIGYFPAGDWQQGSFVSLRSHLPEEWRDFGEAWSLHSRGDEVWMASGSRIYRWDGDAFEVWPIAADSRVIFHFDAEGIFYHVAGQGIYRFDEGQSTLYADDPDLARFSQVLWQSVGSGRYLGVSLDGFFEWSSNRRELLHRHRCSELYQAVPAAAVRLDDGRIVVATLQSGLLFYSADYELELRLDSASGAPSDLVTGLKLDSEGGLWAFFSGALLRLDLKRPGGQFSADSQLPSGVVRGVARMDGRYRIATDQGLFEQLETDNGSITNFARLSGEGLRNDFYPVPGSDGRDMLVVEYGSIHYWRDGTVKGTHPTDGYIRALSPSHQAPGQFWVLLDQAFALLEWQEDDGWRSVQQMQDLPTVAEYIHEDRQGRLWFSAPGSALVMGDWTEGGELQLQTFRSPAGFNLEERNWLLIPWGKSVALVSAAALCVYEEDSWHLASLPEGGLPAPPWLAVEWTEDSLFMVCRSGDGEQAKLVRLERDSAGSARIQPFHHPGWQSLGSPRGIQLSGTAEQAMLHLWGGRGILNMSLDMSTHIERPRKPVLKEWRVDGELIDTVAAARPRIAFDYSEMQVAFASTGFRAARPYQYQLRLGGEDAQWGGLSSQSRRELGRLLEGEYYLAIRAVDANGRASEALVLSFQILPPWYRTVWAYGSYLFTIGMGIWIIVYYRERNLRKRKRMLEQLVAQRTLELEKASRIKSDFIANMSHEIRNPLNGVIGLISRLRPGEAVPERHQQALRRAAQYLQTTVEEVLDFSRIESGHIELNIQAFDPESILEGVIEIYSERAVSKKLKLTFSPRNAGAWQVISDPSKVQQIAGNLVGNAVKFTDKGGVHLGLSIDEVEAGKGLLKFWVQDTGPGIPEEEQKKVFGKYYQIQREGDDSHRAGTGLGLSLCHDFVKRLGGSMQLFSEYGEGSTFTVTIPVGLQAAQPPAALTADQPALPTLRVLVVEDLEYNRLFLEDWLREQGCVVNTCVDGESGYAEARSGHYDLIFLDWDLPRMSGLEVAQSLRKTDSPASQARIIGMTAFATMETRKACLDAGMDTFITKPISEDRLLAVLREAAASTGVPAAVSEPTTEPEVDWEVLERMSKAKQVPLSSEFERFLGILDEQLEELESTLKGSDLEAGRHQIHAMLGHSGLIRFQAFTEAVLDLQVAFLSEDKLGVETEWQRVQQARRRLDAVLAELKQGSAVQ
ncbi:MAG: response regulator [Opitutales bacterium]|nr:response regulator [Opitutales bacterium]